MPNSSALICAIVFATLHTSVRAANAAELKYQAPAACPDREELSFRITRALGKPLEGAPATRFEVAVRAIPSGFGATLRAEGGLKERYLEAQDCSQLIDAVSVAIVLALGALESGENSADTASDHDARQGSSVLESSSPAEEAPASAAVSDEPEPPASPSADATTVRPGVFIWMLGDVGSLPSPGLGVGIGAYLAWSSWRVRAHASVLFEQHVDLDVASAVSPGADLGLTVGAVAFCRSSEGQQLGAWMLALCLGGELGRMSGRGTSVVPERSGGAFWAAPSIDGNARLDLGAGVGLDLALGAVLPLTRNPFIIDEIGRIHQASSLAGRSALGMSWNFR
jgi:hypothetical protein